MNIYNEEPKDWIDLQNKVAYILKSCGYAVETPKKVQAAREEIEIDVYASNSDALIACECKYWESNIPQSIVFAFRTVVQDIGVNKGIIIAKKGFQSGAYNSIQNTNIELKTWEEFLEQYKEKYLKTQIKNFLKIKSKLYRVASDKWEYWKYYDSLDEHKRGEVYQLRNELLNIVLQFSELCIMLQYEEDEEIGWDVEYIDEIITNAEKNFGKKFPDYVEFFEYMKGRVSDIVPKIESLYGIKILGS